MELMRLPLLVMYAALALSPAAARTEGLSLRFPAACDLGGDCWLMNLPDTEKDPDKARDYTCGTRTYDGHDGTDIAIADRAAMEAGVDVVAAAAGTVQRLRDGEEDIYRDQAGKDRIKSLGKECGNGLIIDHGDNWATQYCHLKKGSFRVKQGDAVKAGQVIAQIGMSGFTDHPHVHLTVRHKGEAIDPFTGREIKEGCGLRAAPLWAERVPLDSFNLYDGGFAAEKPDFALIATGLKPPVPDAKADKIMFWFAYFAARKGDRVDISLTAPTGAVLSQQQIVQDKDQARQYYFTGRVARANGFNRGVYKGEARVTRVSATGETETQKIEREFTLQ